MLELTKTQTTAGLTELRMVVPREKADLIADALRNLLLFSGQEVSLREEHAENVSCTLEEAFPQANGGTAIRGLRAREGMTQAQLAERLNIRQHHVSEMENGRRSIGTEMAHRLGELFDISYRVFL